MNRGRIQAQDSNLEKSASWTIDEAHTKTMGMGSVDDLVNQLEPRELRDRDIAFDKVRERIRTIPACGVSALWKKSYYNDFRTREVRVDIDVLGGVGFIDDPMKITSNMAEKYLYQKFKEDKRIYNLNQGYWKRKLQSRLKEKLSSENVLFRNVDAKGKKIYDANPIFTFIDIQQTKGIRIIQDDIMLLETSKDYLEKDLIGAWIDKISIYDAYSVNSEKPKEIKELVIALFMTKETVEKTMRLILFWMNNELTNESIKSILEE